MTLYQEEKDYYYIDMFNLVPGPITKDTKARHSLESTVRLYTTKGSGEAIELDKCIFVAPYIEPISYSGTNVWTNGGESVMDIAVNKATEMAKWWQDQMQDLKNDVNRMDTLKAVLPDSWVDGIKNMAQKATENLTSNAYDYQVYNLGQFKKAFGGTQVTHPLTSISATYFSDKDDFTWFATDNSIRKQPLRRICSSLMTRLLGTMVPLTDATLKKPGDSSIDTKSAAIQFSPNMIQGKQMTAIDGAVENAFALVIGCGQSSDLNNTKGVNVLSGNGNETVTKQTIINQPNVLWNVLPTQLVISPSRLLTPDNDYYYVKIDISFEMASYLDVTTLAKNWIGEDIYDDVKKDFEAST